MDHVATAAAKLLNDDDAVDFGAVQPTTEGNITTT